MLQLPRLRVRVAKSGRASHYFDDGGTPRRWIALGSDERVVQRRYDELMAAHRAPAGTVNSMLGDVLVHLEAQRKVRPSTLRLYRVFRKHLAGVFVGSPLDVTQADVRRYLRLCPRTSFRGEISLLSQAFDLWMDKGLLDFNPCLGVRVGRAKAQRTRLPTFAEIEAVIAAADERDAVAYELKYATGLRTGDLVALRWADLDGAFRTQKTAAAAAIDASDVLTPILARAKALQARVASLYVLCDRQGKPRHPETLRQHWRNDCEAAGVEDCRMHDMRATAATEIERQHGVEAARQFLTHRDIRTTMIYLRDRRAAVIQPQRRKRA